MLVIRSVVQTLDALRLVLVLILVLVPIPLLLGWRAGRCASNVVLSLLALGVDIVSILLCLLLDLIVGLLGLLLDLVLGLASLVKNVLRNLLGLLCCGGSFVADLLQALAGLANNAVAELLNRWAQTCTGVLNVAVCTLASAN